LKIIKFLKQMDKKAISLACRMDSERAINLTKKLFDFLVKEGEVVHLETRIAPKIFPHYGRDLNETNSQNTKFIISIGGDGTILRVANGLPQVNPPPILGVNIGSLGFLDESNERTIFSDLKRALKEDFILEQCSKITPFILRNGEEHKLDNALNEILVISSKSTKVLLVSIKVDGVFLNRSYLDGVIVSTSTGSTAYNLSAGGSIVKSSLDIMQLVPLNSFARSGLKPIILPIDSEVEIKLLRHRLDADIVIDGQKSIRNVSPNTIIKIRKASSYSNFIRFSKNLSDNYIRRIRKKIIGTIRVPLDDSPEEDTNSHF
jgi:NAD+ kinase